MERDDLIELGTASTDTHGEPVGWPPEFIGYFPLGLTDR
jgi:hypothetical protein